MNEVLSSLPSFAYQKSKCSLGKRMECLDNLICPGNNFKKKKKDSDKEGVPQYPV